MFSSTTNPAGQRACISLETNVPKVGEGLGVEVGLGHKVGQGVGVGEGVIVGLGVAVESFTINSEKDPASKTTVPLLKNTDPHLEAGQGSAFWRISAALRWKPGAYSNVGLVYDIGYFRMT